MGNNSKSSVVYQGKIPGRVKYTFAFGALGKDLIYGMIATFSMIYFTDIIKVALSVYWNDVLRGEDLGCVQ